MKDTSSGGMYRTKVKLLEGKIFVSWSKAYFDQIGIIKYSNIFFVLFQMSELRRQS